MMPGGIPGEYCHYNAPPFLSFPKENRNRGLTIALRGEIFILCRATRFPAVARNDRTLAGRRLIADTQNDKAQNPFQSNDKIEI
jgi:hypothetical protein